MIGGAVFGTVAFVVEFSIAYRLLAIITGFITGYFACDPKQIIVMAPYAWRSALSEDNRLGKNIRKIKEWVSEEHPMFYFGALTTVICATAFYIYCAGFITFVTGETVIRTADLVLDIIVALLVGALGYCCQIFLVLGGINLDKCYVKHWETSGESKGYPEKQMTYKNILRWTGIALLYGLRKVLVFFIWTIWKWIFVFIGALLYLAGRFLHKLLLYINSHERIFCGLSSVIGGSLCALCFAPKPFPSIEYFLAILFCAISSAAVGLLIGKAAENYIWACQMLKA